MQKKGVSQIVTTILIILLVLAVIVILWQAVKNIVEKGAGDIETKANCIDVMLSLSNLACSSTGAISAAVSRESDNAEDVKMKIIVDNEVSEEIAAPDALGTTTVTPTDAGVPLVTLSADVNVTVTVKVAAVIAGGTCNPSDTKTVTCPKAP